MCTIEQRMIIEITTCSHFVITNIYLEHRGSWREETLVKKKRKIEENL